MDLWQLKVFSKVVEFKSFSLAARAVHLSQPTVSSHIKDLEQHYGCRLIDRLAKEALPTQAGRLLYDYARRLLALSDETETALAGFQGKTKGRFMVGGSTIPGCYLLPRMIGAFKKEFPDVVVALIVRDTAEILAEIASGRLEVGIVGAESRDQGLIQEKLLRDELRLIVPENHPWARRRKVSLPSLLNEPFIVRESGSGTLQAIQEALFRQGHGMTALKVVAEMSGTEAICQGIRNGVGVSILSTLAVADDLHTGRLRALTVEGLNMSRHFYLTRRKARTPSPLCEHFVAFLKAYLSK
jgi:DNA-binding transcriptional LysR family regulator